MRKRARGLGAATIITALLLAGCGGTASGGDERPAAQATTTTPSAAPRDTAPADNGISRKPLKEIVAASERAFRSARSVKVDLTAKEKDGLLRMNLEVTKAKDASGWFEQGGVRVNLIAVDGRFYIRSRKLWEQQGNPEVAKLIGDRWVLVPRAAVGELTPIGKEMTIAGLADLIFSSNDTPTFLRKREATLDGVPAVRLLASDGSYYVAARGKPYPLLLDGSGSNDDIAFSHYDETPAIKAPRGALDIEKLQG